MNPLTLTSGPDLTQRPPRSPRVRLGGYVLLPRILDKGRATLAGKLGAYRFSGKGMDRHFFNFTGLDHESLKAELAKGGGDTELLAWVNGNGVRSGSMPKRHSPPGSNRIERNGG